MRLRMYRVFAVLLLFQIHLTAQLYVAPGGSDSNPGTIDLPFKTPQKALTAITAGGTIYLRGGVYNLSTQVKPNVNGTEGNYCRMFAYPGERPVFDFTGLNDRGIYIARSYWHIKGIEVRFAGNNGICISTGGYNIIEGCVSHDNSNEGIKITGGGHHNLILNCDSYRNYDAANHGENADGFAAKSGIGIGNVFRGCRAWWNSDDGWDFYGCPVQVIIDSCFAFKNGVNLWNDPSWQGDGNAFKLGGAGDTATHIVRNSVAFDNTSKGFDQNHSTSGMIIYNCTGFRNKNPNFSFYETPAGGKRHILRNCVSHSGTVQIDATAILEKNSWQGFSVTDADFQSVDTALALKPRQSDYSMPHNGFMRLASGSGLIDKGVNVGLPFTGTAPDLGAFEFKGVIDTRNDHKANKVSGFELGQNYPNPFNPVTRIPFTLPRAGYVEIMIYDQLGRELLTLARRDYAEGTHLVDFDASRLHTGIYFYRISVGNYSEIKKMLLLQ